MNRTAPDKSVLQQTLIRTQQALLDARNVEGTWDGRLSSSPLATAAAIFALHQMDAQKYCSYVDKSLHWLANMQQADGSWGDAEQLDPGNLSTTLLCYAAVYAIRPKALNETVKKGETWICGQTGDMQAENICGAVYRVYGRDRTFAVPILTMCALAGVLGADGWRHIKPLPFEMAALPREFFRRLKLNVVSYALPALIAIGQVKFHFDPPHNPVTRWLRNRLKRITLKRLERIQPENGGFLEATPLTAFVTMSLAAMGRSNHPVTLRGAEFITRSMRNDGSWPIDTNLSTWVTSLSVCALQPQNQQTLSLPEKETICRRLLDRQFQQVHPYTGARPGGWGWTNLPGSVPDADDTAGVLIVLHVLGIRNEQVMHAVKAGIDWLIDLQNSDGGIPTFCRGWGRLEFDRSCPDITAHAVTAWHRWQTELDDSVMQMKMSRAIERAINYLSAKQRPDGSWLPLWFGNPFLPAKTNPVYGTAKVLEAMSQVSVCPLCRLMSDKAVDYLLAAQNDDTGWGAQKTAPSTIEETALAINALSRIQTPAAKQAITAGLRWLSGQIHHGAHFPTAPIGLYFAKLWYAERLYPVIFSLQALQNAFVVLG